MFCALRKGFLKMAERRKSYAELLKDPRWQKKRLEVFERDKWKCVLCECSINDEKTFHVHHWWYDRGVLPWDYIDGCYSTLCEPCHEKVTRKMKVLCMWLASGLFFLDEVVGYAMGHALQTRDRSSIRREHLTIDMLYGMADAFHLQDSVEDKFIYGDSELINNDVADHFRRLHQILPQPPKQPSTSSPLDTDMCFV